MTGPRRLPAAPLLAAVDRHPAVGKPRRGWKTRLRRYAGTTGLAAYRRAARDGWVTLRSLEALCDRFGWHPRELYGDAYDHAAFRRPLGQVRPLEGDRVTTPVEAPAMAEVEPWPGPRTDVAGAWRSARGWMARAACAQPGVDPAWFAVDEDAPARRQ